MGLKTGCIVGCEIGGFVVLETGCLDGSESVYLSVKEQAVQWDGDSEDLSALVQVASLAMGLVF